MIRTEIVTEKSNIDSIRHEWLALATQEKAPLPFQYMHMPLVYWDTFHDNDEPFWKKRGKNFLGLQTSLKKFYLLIARNNDRLCGVLPLIQLSVKVRGKRHNLKIIAICGDYVLHPFQDFLVAEDQRESVLMAMLQRLPDLLKHNDLIWLGYIPEESPNLKVLQNAVKKLPNCETQEAISSERGGVWPWRLGKIVNILREIEHIRAKTGLEIDGLAELTDKMSACSPQALMFPNTRARLLENILSILPLLRQHEELSYLSEKLNALLNNSPMVSPYLELPPDWEGYLKTLSSSTRRHYKYYLKKYFQAGAGFETVMPDEITDKDIEDYIRLHLLRWGAKTASMSGVAADYHRNVAKSMSRLGFFTLFFAIFEGKRIAVESVFDIGPRRESVIAGLDPEYLKLRLGHVIRLYAIKDSIKRGKKWHHLGPVGFDNKLKQSNNTAVAHNFFFYSQGNEPDLDNIFTGFECMTPVR